MWIYVSYLKSVMSKLKYLSVDPSGRAKVWVCGHSLAVVVGSNLTGSIDVCLWDCCVLSGRRSLQRPSHSSRGFLQIEVCLSVISKAQQRSDLDPLGVLEPWGKIIFMFLKVVNYCCQKVISWLFVTVTVCGSFVYVLREWILSSRLNTKLNILGALI
jgi:hypothetical protein